jgi:UDP-N-acetylmuramoyl-tripeptide--D-alanyl-D-alanine ligase
MKSAFKILSMISTRKNKIAVLGDMFELGRESKVKHLELAENLMGMNIDQVYSIGKMMKLFDSKLNNRVKTHKHFDDRNSLKNFLNKISLNDSVILIKGSRGMKMEEFVSVIQSRKN